jgi:hypothetical protein
LLLPCFSFYTPCYPTLVTPPTYSVFIPTHRFHPPRSSSPYTMLPHPLILPTHHVTPPSYPVRLTYTMPFTSSLADIFPHTLCYFTLLFFPHTVLIYPVLFPPYYPILLIFPHTMYVTRPNSLSFPHMTRHCNSFHTTTTHFFLSVFLHAISIASQENRHPCLAFLRRILPVFRFTHSYSSGAHRLNFHSRAVIPYGTHCRLRRHTLAFMTTTHIAPGLAHDAREVTTIL